MALASDWRDPRFAHATHRKSFETAHHTGAAHGTMLAAGSTLKVRSSSAAALPKVPSPPAGPSHGASIAYGQDQRFHHSATLRPPAFSSGSRGLPTSESAHPRQARAVQQCHATSHMKAAGQSTVRRGEICMMGWHGYKQTVRNLANNGGSIVASCPDLAALGPS
mmetsp:Transcript_102320/g.329936  ORF Transcript_102320/g.329936 Transcript_102320/m.329936 type:complete len:165 (+) Transcript_102320:76-570(+)